MAKQYFYERESKQLIGPYSGPQLKALAAAGKILPTDTIWKKGVKRGMLAKKLKNLFPAEQRDRPLPDDAAPRD